MRTLLCILALTFTMLPDSGYGARAIKDGDRTFIRDVTGHRFDITEAIEKYGMEARKFNYGLGRNYFKPIDHPPWSKQQPRGADNDVIAVVYQGIARAYDFGKLQRAETLLDTFAGTEVIVGRCVLADLSAMWLNDHEGKALTMQASGWTYEGNRRFDTFVLMDRETESLWFPFDDGFGLQAVSGPLEGSFLPEIKKLDKTTWRSFSRANAEAQYAYD